MRACVSIEHVLGKLFLEWIQSAKLVSFKAYWEGFLWASENFSLGRRFTRTCVEPSDHQHGGRWPDYFQRWLSSSHFMTISIQVTKGGLSWNFFSLYQQESFGYEIGNLSPHWLERQWFNHFASHKSAYDVVKQVKWLTRYEVLRLRNASTMKWWDILFHQT